MNAAYPSSSSSLFNPIRPLTLLCLFLWFLVAILLISAAGSPTLATNDGTNEGAFQICIDGGGCHQIDTHCQITYQGQTQKLFTGSDCSDLQAVRAFLIMGLLLAIAITILTFFMFFTHRMADRTLYVVAHVMMAVESLFVMIAFSVAASLLNEYNSNKGGAFGCLVSAWVFGLIAWGLWAAAAQFEEEGVRGLGVVSTGMTGGTQQKTVAEQPYDPNANVQSVTVAPGGGQQQPPAPYGGQPTFAYPQQQQYPQQYQQQPMQQQQYQQQFQPQYQQQPQQQPQYAAAPQQQYQQSAGAAAARPTTTDPYQQPLETNDTPQ